MRLKRGRTGEQQRWQRALHITPHFRRNNHSVIGRPSRSRKTTGISHSCFVLRTEIPASEYDTSPRSEEHTSELQSLTNLVCRLLLEKKKTRVLRRGARSAPGRPARAP